jgi:hypothetical protein
MVAKSDVIVAAAYKQWRTVAVFSLKVFVMDAFATVQDIYSEIPDDILFDKEFQDIPSITVNRTNVQRQITPRASPKAASHASRGATPNNNSDSTESFRSAMGLDVPHGALTVDDLLDHEGKVWAVLKQHSRSTRQLVAVFASTFDAQKYARDHKGMQKGYDCVTTMFDENNSRGVMLPLKTAYYAALGRRANQHAGAAPTTPNRPPQSKRSRQFSPGSNNDSTASSSSTLSSQGVPRTDFFASASSGCAEWIFPQHDAGMVQCVVSMCPDEHLEELRELLRITSDINTALLQVTDWRTTNDEPNDEA